MAASVVTDTQTHTLMTTVTLAHALRVNEALLCKTLMRRGLMKHYCAKPWACLQATQPSAV